MHTPAPTQARAPAQAASASAAAGHAEALAGRASAPAGHAVTPAGHRPAVAHAPTRPGRHGQHLALAEDGRRLALAGRHAQALDAFRTALQQAQMLQAPQLLARHYLQGVIECLEHLGRHQAVEDLCQQLITLQTNAGLDSPFHRRDRAALLERIGIAQHNAGKQAAAQQSLAAATTQAGPGVLPLAEQLLAWLQRGLTVGPVRLAELQRRHGYYTLRDSGTAARPSPEPEHPHGQAR